MGGSESLRSSIWILLSILIQSHALATLPLGKESLNWRLVGPRMGQDMANTLPLQGLNPSHQAYSCSFYWAILDHDSLGCDTRSWIVKLYQQNGKWHSKRLSFKLTSQRPPKYEHSSENIERNYTEDMERSPVDWHYPSDVLLTAMRKPLLETTEVAGGEYNSR